MFLLKHYETLCNVYSTGVKQLKAQLVNYSTVHTPLRSLPLQSSAFMYGGLPRHAYTPFCILSSLCLSVI